MRPLAASDVGADARATAGFDYVVLFESSGMYRGEDVVGLVSQLVFLPLDAVWGSRRLSVNDVQEAMRLVYRRKWLLGTVSYFGSHLLSLLYLVLYGRYIYDSLSGVRAIRARFLSDLHVEPGHKQANHQLLTALLRHRAEILETPVRFFPIGPHQTRRTTILDGVRAAVAIVDGRGWGRLTRAGRPTAPRPDSAVEARPSKKTVLGVSAPTGPLRPRPIIRATGESFEDGLASDADARGILLCARPDTCWPRRSS